MAAPSDLLRAGRALFTAISRGEASIELESTLATWDPSDVWGDVMRDALDGESTSYLTNAGWEYYLQTVAQQGDAATQACTLRVIAAIKSIAATPPNLSSGRSVAVPTVANCPPTAAASVVPSPCDRLIPFVFQMLDRNRRGNIGWEEASCVYTEGEWADVVAVADVSGSGRVTAAEWSTWMHGIRTSAGDAALSEELRSVRVVIIIFSFIV